MIQIRTWAERGHFNDGWLETYRIQRATLLTTLGIFGKLAYAAAASPSFAESC